MAVATPTGTDGDTDGGSGGDGYSDGGSGGDGESDGHDRNSDSVSRGDGNIDYGGGYYVFRSHTWAVALLQHSDS